MVVATTVAVDKTSIFNIFKGKKPSKTGANRGPGPFSASCAPVNCQVNIRAMEYQKEKVHEV